MATLVRRAFVAALCLLLCGACGAEAPPRQAQDVVTPPDPAAVGSEPTGPAVDGTELLLKLGQTRHFWKTWVVTFHSLKRYTPTAEEMPPGWHHQGPTWAATITLRTLRENPIRIRPTLTVRSGEGAPGTFGGFLGYPGQTDLGPADRLNLRALIGTEGANAVTLVLDLGVPGQPRITLTGG